MEIKPSIILYRRTGKWENSISLSSEEISHLKSLRLFNQDKLVEFRDGTGNILTYQFGSLSEFGKQIDSRFVKPLEKDIQVITAIPASGKLEWLLEKGTELGITHFIFTNFLQSERKELNLHRAEKIILNSCIQSKRERIPEILFLPKPKEIYTKFTNLFYLHPYAEKELRELDFLQEGIPLIGPEGGFRNEEISEFKKNGLEGYRLGKNILRIETAIIAISTIFNYERNKSYDRY